NDYAVPKVLDHVGVTVLEARTAMRVTHFELRPQSFGNGRFRGGPGLQRDIVFTGPGELLTIAKKTRPWSVAGGDEPEPSRFVLFAGSDRERRAGTARVRVEAGGRMRVETAGGAGYGEAADRDPGLVGQDPA
ncbi:MAG: hydantoinase B/oxoprolinase family protein, partial [bacterium]|nr:hydantoinase B/oxoprolinase family protein [bacterium]